MAINELGNNLDRLIREHCDSIRYWKSEIDEKRKEAESCLSTLEEMQQMDLLTDDLRQSFKTALQNAKEALRDLQNKCETIHDDGLKKIQEAREQYRMQEEKITGTAFGDEVISALNLRNSELDEMESMLEEAMDGVDDDDDPPVLEKVLRR